MEKCNSNNCKNFSDKMSNNCSVSNNYRVLLPACHSYIDQLEEELSVYKKSMEDRLDRETHECGFICWQVDFDDCHGCYEEFDNCRDKTRHHYLLQARKLCDNKNCGESDKDVILKRPLKEGESFNFCEDCCNKIKGEA